MNQEPIAAGKVLGGILLVAGCCIGAGMLGLPVLSAAAGFIPSLFWFIICWLFMLCTGFLLLEANLWFKEEVSLITIAEKTLGPLGKIICWCVFLFLFYSLMVAYLAASGALIADFTQITLNKTYHPGIGTALFCLLFAFLLYWGALAVDWFNRLLMAGLIISYLVLIVMGIPHVKLPLLMHQDWSASTLMLPAMIVSFGYHNLIPSLKGYFHGQIIPLKKVFFLGSLLPLLIYIIWEGIILGLVPAQNFAAALDQGEVATETLRGVVGSNAIFNIAQSFAFFSLMTSLLSIALSFVDFLSDGLHIPKTKQGKCVLIALALAPPYLCALLYPTIFLIALNTAGGFGAVVLFGILPVLMVWKGRYWQNLNAPQLVPGGRVTLLAVMAFSLWILFLQLY